MDSPVSPGNPALSTTPEISSRMSQQRTVGTSPELALRRALHARGLRYRVDFPLPGMPRRRADVTFTRARVAVFVDGCFWHSCPMHGTAPKNNAAWWAAKLTRNVARDREIDRTLQDAGWMVVRVWEHEDPGMAAIAIEALVTARS